MALFMYSGTIISATPEDQTQEKHEIYLNVFFLFVLFFTPVFWFLSSWCLDNG